MNPPKAINLNGYRHILYHPISYDRAITAQKAKEYFNWLDTRRSVRDIADTPVSKDVIEHIILSASTAPSGAHKQPWTICAINNQALKSKIRVAAEIEEKENYESRMSERWKRDLLPIGTNMNKPFLENAPWLIIVFKQIYEYDADGNRYNNYYVNESVGIACGMLLSAIHNAGLVTLTHTPSPMNFLSTLLERPDNERPFLICPVGYASNPAYVPDLRRKTLNEVSKFYM